MTITQFLERHKQLNGVILIRILRASQGRKLHVLELSNRLYNVKYPGRAANPAQHWLAQNPIPMADAEAIRQYKRELWRLGVKLRNAQAAGDTDLSAALERELEAIRRHLRSVTLPGGRIKNFPLEPDLAYHAVFNSVKRVKAKAQAECPALYDFIRDRVHIGQYCYLRG